MGPWIRTFIAWPPKPSWLGLSLSPLDRQLHPVTSTFKILHTSWVPFSQGHHHTLSFFGLFVPPELKDFLPERSSLTPHQAAPPASFSQSTVCLFSLTLSPFVRTYVCIHAHMCVMTVLPFHYSVSSLGWNLCLHSESYPQCSTHACVSVGALLGEAISVSLKLRSPRAHNW